MSRNPWSRQFAGAAVVLLDLTAGGVAHACDLMTPAVAALTAGLSLAGLLLTARGIADAVLPRE